MELSSLYIELSQSGFPEGCDHSNSQKIQWEVIASFLDIDIFDLIKVTLGCKLHVSVSFVPVLEQILYIRESTRLTSWF